MYLMGMFNAIQNLGLFYATYTNKEYFRLIGLASWVPLLISFTLSHKFPGLLKVLPPILFFVRNAALLMVRYWTFEKEVIERRDAVYFDIAYFLMHAIVYVLFLSISFVSTAIVAASLLTSSLIAWLFIMIQPLD